VFKDVKVFNKGIKLFKHKTQFKSRNWLFYKLSKYMLDLIVNHKRGCFLIGHQQHARMTSPRRYNFFAAVFYKNLIFRNNYTKRFNLSTYLIGDYNIYIRGLIYLTRNDPNWVPSEFAVSKHFETCGSILNTKFPIFKSMSVYNGFFIRENFIETNYYMAYIYDNLVTEGSLIFKNLKASIFPSRISQIFNYMPESFRIIDAKSRIKPTHPDRFPFLPTFKFLNRRKNIYRLFKTPINLFINSLSKNNSKNNNESFVFQNFEVLCALLLSPLFLKFIIFKSLNSVGRSFRTMFYQLPAQANKYIFYSKMNRENSNILPDKNFFFFIKKQVLKIFSYHKFSISATPWYFNTMIRFIEYCSGKKAHVRFFTLLTNYLNFYEKTRCLM